MPDLKTIFALTRQLTALHRELEVPASYAVDRKLAPHFEASAAELIEIGQNPDGRPVQLIRPAAAAWHRLQHAAAAQGIALLAISGFRSIERQAEIIRGKRARGQSLAEILRVTAAPGFSEHHTGRALDLGTAGHPSLEEDFAATPAFRWLEEHAAKFGFALSYPRDNPHGLIHEPWHWCWHTPEREKHE